MQKFQNRDKLSGNDFVQAGREFIERKEATAEGSQVLAQHFKHQASVGVFSSRVLKMVQQLGKVTMARVLGINFLQLEETVEFDASSVCSGDFECDCSVVPFCK